MKRPFLVALVAIIMILTGVLQLLVAFLAFIDRNDAEMLNDADATSSQITTAVIALVIAALISIFLGSNLWRGKRFARALIGIFEVFQIAGAIYLLVVSEHKDHVGTAIGTILGALIVLYFLFGTQKAKQFFA